MVTSPFSFCTDGTPCAVKVACTVWAGGKDGDSIKVLPISIKIVQGNTSNIVFLKSTDDSMLDTLQKMSGVTHRAFRDSKTVTVDKERMVMQNEGKLTYTVSVREVPVITYNDMAFISERNSMIFRAGDSPIWNRNQTILPMSWRLFQNTIVHPGHEYSLQTIPTLSSALDFDVRKNQPDFNRMLQKRMDQAFVADLAKEAYQQAYGYSDTEIEQLDPDNYADEVMTVINDYLRQKKAAENPDMDAEFEYEDDMEWLDETETNTEQLEATAKEQEKLDKASVKRYAGGLLSREDLISSVGGPQHTFDQDIIGIYKEYRGDFWQDREHFTVQGTDLCGTNGKVYIRSGRKTENLQALQDAAKDKKSRVFADGDLKQSDLDQIGSYEVTDDFYRFLISMDRWTFANGRFESEMARRMNA